MVDNNNFYGKYLKLTSNRFMIEFSCNMYLVMSTNDNRKLFLSCYDIDILRHGITDKPVIVKLLYDLYLDKTIVKLSSDDNYYSFICQKTSKFEMGLKRETIVKIVNFYTFL